MLQPKSLNVPSVPACSKSKISDDARDAKANQQGDSIISPPKHQPVSLDEIRERCKKIKCKLSVNEKEIAKIKSETRGNLAIQNGLNIDLAELLLQNVTEWLVYIGLTHHLPKSSRVF